MPCFAKNMYQAAKEAFHIFNKKKLSLETEIYLYVYIVSIKVHFIFTFFYEGSLKDHLKCFKEPCSSPQSKEHFCSS